MIESYAKRFGYGVVRDFTGHGIGTAFHTGLIIPHYDDPHATTGDAAGHDVHDRADADARAPPTTRCGPDKWTAVTRDRKRTAQFEHTMVVTNDGVEVLTLPSGG